MKKNNKKDQKPIFEGIDQELIDTVIVDNMQIGDEGLMKVKRIDLAKLKNIGVKDVNQFLEGILDFDKGNDFNNSDADYIKGFRHAQTGI